MKDYASLSQEHAEHLTDENYHIEATQYYNFAKFLRSSSFEKLSAEEKLNAVLDFLIPEHSHDDDNDNDNDNDT